MLLLLLAVTAAVAGRRPPREALVTDPTGRHRGVLPRGQPVLVHSRGRGSGSPAAAATGRSRGAAEKRGFGRVPAQVGISRERKKPTCLINRGEKENSSHSLSWID